MRRLACLLLLTACAGSREVSKIRYTSTDCPDPAGCEVTLGSDDTYHPPDEAHGGDPVVETAAGRPPPSCETVAVALVSVELGTYAADEDGYADKLAAHQKTCAAARLTAREIACTSSITTSEQLGYCTTKLPTMPVPLVEVGACAATIEHIAPVLQQMQLDEHRKELLASCEKDRWPRAFVDGCFTRERYHYRGSLDSCRDLAPGWLFEQLNARLAVTTP